MKEDKRVFDKDQVRRNTDLITEELDRQAIENIKTLQRKRNYEEELIASLNKLNAHSICPGSVPTCDNYERPTQDETPVQESVKHEVHGADCHCSKCCPNPNPNIFQRHKQAILIGLLWVAMIVLGVGWSPSGATFEAIQSSYLDLIVNFFKMGIFAVAGIVTYNLVKKRDE